MVRIQTLIRSWLMSSIMLARVTNLGPVVRVKEGP